MKHLIGLIFLTISLSPAWAQEQVHDHVRTGLLHLTATGTPSLETHPQLGVRGGVQSQGTGFFVGTDGFILTTRHFLKPLEDAKAKQVSFSASIGDANARSFPLLVASELDRVDLLLMKAKLPFDMPPPQPLRIGRTSSYDRRSPGPLFTSGFENTTYRRKTAEYNAAESDEFPYAWSLNVKTNSGQSGSPVYDADGTVLGVIKGTVGNDDTLTLMIPIEFAMPLIGHMEIDRLNRQVTLLRSVIGELTQDDPPLNDRLRDIEGDMEELGSRFTWSAETSPDGTLRIRYEKLIGGGLQIDGIRIAVKPNMRIKENDGFTIQPMRPMKLSENGENFFARDFLDADKRVGEFVIPNVYSQLAKLIEVFDAASDEPYRDLELTVVPTMEDEQLATKKMKIVPAYTWN